MKIKQYQVDAFASHVFEGNPAAVCPLDCWLDDGLLQSIAAENNLSETAFFVPSAKGTNCAGSPQFVKLICVGMQRWQLPMSFFTSWATPGSALLLRRAAVNCSWKEVA